MKTLATTQTATDQWHTLISEARKANLVDLSEEVESYLVFLLIRFVAHPEIAESVLGKEYLETVHCPPQIQQLKLREVGDKCLLMAGLFPSRSHKKLVKISYFVNLGRNAYSTLSQISLKESTQSLYTHLSDSFVPMMDVLQSTRELETRTYTQLNLIDAVELWRETKSQYAWQTIRHYTNIPNISIMPK